MMGSGIRNFVKSANSFHFEVCWDNEIKNLDDKIKEEQKKFQAQFGLKFEPDVEDEDVYTRTSTFSEPEPETGLDSEPVQNKELRRHFSNLVMRFEKLITDQKSSDEVIKSTKQPTSPEGARRSSYRRRSLTDSILEVNTSTDPASMARSKTRIFAPIRIITDADELDNLFGDYAERTEPTEDLSPKSEASEFTVASELMSRCSSVEDLSYMLEIAENVGSSQEGALQTIDEDEDKDIEFYPLTTPDLNRSDSVASESGFMPRESTDSVAWFKHDSYGLDHNWQKSISQEFRESQQLEFKLKFGFKFGSGNDLGAITGRRLSTYNVDYSS
jgi:hypothetical protein